MLQLHQHFMKFSTKNFPKVFRGIIPEKYRYFSEISGKIPQEISELTTLNILKQYIVKHIFRVHQIFTNFANRIKSRN